MFMFLSDLKEKSISWLHRNMVTLRERWESQVAMASDGRSRPGKRMSGHFQVTFNPIKDLLETKRDSLLTSDTKLFWILIGPKSCHSFYSNHSKSRDC